MPDLQLAVTARKLGGHFVYSRNETDFGNWFSNPLQFDPRDAKNFQRIQSDNFIIYALWSSHSPGFSTDNEFKKTLATHNAGGADGLYSTLLSIGYQNVDDPSPGDLVFFRGGVLAENDKWTHEGIVGEDGTIWHLTSGHKQVSYSSIERGHLYFYREFQYVRPPQ